MKWAQTWHFTPFFIPASVGDELPKLIRELHFMVPPSFASQSRNFILILNLPNKRMYFNCEAMDKKSIWKGSCFVQVNLCQKHLFLDQLTHNRTKDCSLIYQFSTWKLQGQNMGRTCCVHKLFWMSKQKQKTICVHNMFSPCSELAVFMYSTGKSMNNLLSYLG